MQTMLKKNFIILNNRLCGDGLVGLSFMAYQPLVIIQCQILFYIYMRARQKVNA